MMKLYSKDALVSAVTAMKRDGRMAHAFLLTGEKGVGKKTAADYIAMTLLCERGGEVPCGECRHCRRILENTHPDVIKPEKTGKKQIYARDTMRAVCSDAYIYPNDCDAKVYIFTDCESIEENTQNLMLKLIEEPPDTAYFIFTAVSAGVFLPTIRSRVVTIGIPECSEEDCTAALADMGYAPDRISEAVKCFHGNIGSCADFLQNGETAENVRICRDIISAICDGNEYELMAAMHRAGDGRNRIKQVMELVDKAIRDACVMRYSYPMNGGGENGRNSIPLIGCDPEGAERLSRKLSAQRAEKIHCAAADVIEHCGANMNVPLEAAAFACAAAG